MLFYFLNVSSASQPLPADRSAKGKYLLAVLAIALTAVAFPMYVIRPFRYQGALEFRAALVVLRWAPWITLVCVLLALLLFIPIWRSAGRKRFAGLRRGILILATLIIVFDVVAARINIFEKMFHPISAVDLIPAAQAKIAGDDMVMSITIGGESHAYPIREMAYHHVVNDWVAGTPVAPTY